MIWVSTSSGRIFSVWQHGSLLRSICEPPGAYSFGLAAYGVHSCLAVMVNMIIGALGEASPSLGKIVCLYWLCSDIESV